MKKRGDFTVSEYAKIVIAVICIVLLLFLGTKFYGIFQSTTRIQQAKATMTELERIINNLPDGGTGKMLLLSPKDWYLVQVGNKACLCDSSNFAASSSENNKNCEKQGICSKGIIEIEGVCLKTGGILYDVQVPNCIALENLPFNLLLTKNGEKSKIEKEMQVPINEGGVSKNVVLNLDSILKTEKDGKTLEQSLEEYAIYEKDLPKEKLFPEWDRQRVTGSFLKEAIPNIQGDWVFRLQIFEKGKTNWLKSIDFYSDMDYSNEDRIEAEEGSDLRQEGSQPYTQIKKRVEGENFDFEFTLMLVKT